MAENFLFSSCASREALVIRSDKAIRHGAGPAIRVQVHDRLKADEDKDTTPATNGFVDKAGHSACYGRVVIRSNVGTLAWSPFPRPGWLVSACA